MNAQSNGVITFLQLDRTQFPTLNPTLNPTLFPTLSPTLDPTLAPPTLNPTLFPTLSPTLDPTLAPTRQGDNDSDSDGDGDVQSVRVPEGAWYPDFELAQCVQNCAVNSGEFCGGNVGYWQEDEIFETAVSCCALQFWFLPKSQCVPGYTDWR